MTKIALEKDSSAAKKSLYFNFCTWFSLKFVHKWYTGNFIGKISLNSKPLTFAPSPSGGGQLGCSCASDGRATDKLPRRHVAPFMPPYGLCPAINPV